jgi:hypothetical protein
MWASGEQERTHVFHDENLKIIWVASKNYEYTFLRLNWGLQLIF